MQKVRDKLWMTLFGGWIHIHKWQDYSFILFQPWLFLEDTISFKRPLCKGNTFSFSCFTQGWNYLLLAPIVNASLFHFVLMENHFVLFVNVTEYFLALLLFILLTFYHSPPLITTWHTFYSLIQNLVFMLLSTIFMLSYNSNHLMVTFSVICLHLYPNGLG